MVEMAARRLLDALCGSRAALAPRRLQRAERFGGSESIQSGVVEYLRLVFRRRVAF